MNSIILVYTGWFSCYFIKFLLEILHICIIYLISHEWSNFSVKLEQLVTENSQ